MREVAEIPGKRPEFNEEAEQQHYEINNEKLCEIFNIPETKNSVKEYLAAECNRKSLFWSAYFGYTMRQDIKKVIRQ